jgi:hypothetical protein
MPWAPTAAASAASTATAAGRRALLTRTFADAADDDSEEDLDPAEAERLRQFREKMTGRFGGPSELEQPQPPASGDGVEKSPRQLRKEAREARKRKAEEGGGGGGAVGGKPFVLKQFATEEELEAMKEEEEAAGDAEDKPWGSVVEAKSVGPGTVLLGNPAVFCDPKCPPSILKRCGLAQHIPVSDMDPDRCADVLPVVLLVEGTASGAGTVSGECVGLFLNRRTGYLLGDLEQVRMPADEFIH